MKMIITTTISQHARAGKCTLVRRRVWNENQHHNEANNGIGLWKNMNITAADNVIN